MSESEEIKHYGVPGMKWGKTKGSYNANTTKYGKENVVSLVASGLLTSPALTVAIGVTNGDSRQKIGTGSGRQS